MLRHVTLHNVTKAYKKSGEILKDLSIEIHKGEIVSLLGPSGSGKSTILKLIAGLEKSDHGKVEVAKANSANCGYVFQDASIMPWRTVRENIELPLELSKISKKQSASRVDAALELVNLKEASELFPFELSGGMKMRTSLARSLVLEPSLLLLDEPFSALDENLRFSLALEVRKIWAEKQITVIIVTHSIAEAIFMTNRALVLSKKPATIASDMAIHLTPKRELSLRTEATYTQELQKMTSAYAQHHGGLK